MRPPLEVCIRACTRVRQVGECIESTYSTGSHGYTQVCWQGEDGRTRMVLVHRLMWMLCRGPIPEDLTIDHICRNPRCVNPLHLRLLTRSANARDNGAARRTHCPSGHPYDEANTYRHPTTNHRACRICKREQNRARRRNER